MFPHEKPGFFHEKNKFFRLACDLPQSGQNLECDEKKRGSERRANQKESIFKASKLKQYETMAFGTCIRKITIEK